MKKEGQTTVCPYGRGWTNLGKKINVGAERALPGMWHKIWNPVGQTTVCPYEGDKIYDSFNILLR